jgi:hypothetical protein
LQHLVGIFEEVFELIALGAQRLGGELRRDLDSRHGGILSDVANLVDLDAGFAGQRGFQLFCERRRLGIATGKGAYKARKLRLRQVRRKVNAGDSRVGQQLRKAFFTSRRA